ncbi:MAG TPA: carboxypeptidase-like regulatory domain-containing protein, partial [Chitinophagaceae bacterium]|nr:carboxypeptidase-like regulatory domain-containing protein [Chitinophagaceae bacterium]
MPRRHYLLTVIALFIASVVFAQKTIDVTGKITDSSGNALSNINVKIRSGQDSAGLRTGINGAFSVRVADKGSVTIELSSIGYKTFIKKFDSPTNRIDAGTIILEQDALLIGEVVVKSVNPVVVKEDTVQYDASAYKVREGAPVEDVIKKLPGVTVDKEGEITAQGKPVTRVRVNGKDFFGGDAKTATQNLPADIIENIQIIDDYGDQANLTGVKNGEPEKIININIRKDKNRGQFGTATVAAGNEGRYAVGLVANNFKDEQQISFLGAINNTNSNLFNFNGGGRGGGARGTNFGGGERGGGGGAGITLSKSAGINYRDAWGKKISVYGSYSFSSRSTNVISTSLTQDINPLNIRSTARTSNNRSGGDNHRATFNFEYRMDSMNYLKVSPYVSLSTSHSANEGQSEISRPSYHTFNTNKSGSESTAPNSGGDLSFNHKFRKKQRNLNVFASINYSYRDQDQSSRNSY